MGLGGVGGALHLLAVGVQLGDLVDLDRGLWRVFDMDVDDTGAVLDRVLSIAEGQRQSVCGVDLGRVAEAGGGLVVVLPILHGHLAELSGEVGRALTLVPGTALSSVDARKMADHDSEVGRRQRVRGVAVLADDGGGVPQLAVVLAAAPHARHLADGGGEDHLDPPGVVPRVEGVLAHREGDGAVGLVLDVGLGVGGVGVVVLGIHHERLALAGVHGHWSDLLLDVLGSDHVGRLLDGQTHLGRVSDRDREEPLRGHLLGYGPLGDDVVPAVVPVGGTIGVSIGVAVGVSVPRQAGVGGGGHGPLLTDLALGARLADAVLGPQAHSSVLALGRTVGLGATLGTRGLTPSVTALPSTDIHPRQFHLVILMNVVAGVPNDLLMLRKLSLLPKRDWIRLVSHPAGSDLATETGREFHIV